MNIGILGGAFDPVHVGHVEMAQLVLKQQYVDEVWLQPCYQHMFGKQMASCQHRLTMCRLATESLKNIKVSGYEIENKFNGKTYDFVTECLPRDFSEKNAYYLIIGMDNALKFQQWFMASSLQKAIKFIVVPRIGINLQGFNYWFERPPHILARDTVRQMSSTYIRELIGNYGPELVTPFVGENVKDYLKEHKLYKGGLN